jgi:EmrB/QacA subfamily drug resistance transporter
VLIAMGGVIGLILLDETVVGVALPSITTELGLSVVASHWVVNAYLLVLAGCAAASGKLGDVIGLKNLFLIGILVFGLASIACGFADSGAWLIATRGLQGIGAAIIFPLSMAMVAIVFVPEERGKALGIYGAIGTTLMALGPLVGGFFTDALSWRWIFWINAPIVIIVAVVVALAWVDMPRPGKRGRFDVAGFISMITGIALIVFALMQAPDWGWSDPWIYGPLLVGAAVLALFVLVELKVNPPLIEVDLFANMSFTACNLVVFLAQYTKIAIIVFGAIFLQDVLGMDAFIAGIAMVAAVGPVPFTAHWAGHLADRFGSRGPSLWGLVAVTIGILWLGLAAHLESYWVMLPALLLWGGALPFIFSPAQRGVMNAVPPEKHGQVSGLNLTAQLLGGAIGMAISGSIYAITDDFRYVCLGTAIASAIVLVIAWFSIEREPARS